MMDSTQEESKIIKSGANEKNPIERQQHDSISEHRQQPHLFPRATNVVTLYESRGVGFLLKAKLGNATLNDLMNLKISTTKHTSWLVPGFKNEFFFDELSMAARRENVTEHDLGSRNFVAGNMVEAEITVNTKSKHVAIDPFKLEMLL